MTGSGPCSKTVKRIAGYHPATLIIFAVLVDAGLLLLTGHQWLGLVLSASVIVLVLGSHALIPMVTPSGRRRSNS